MLTSSPPPPPPWVSALSDFRSLRGSRSVTLFQRARAPAPAPLLRPTDPPPGLCRCSTSARRPGARPVSSSRWSCPTMAPTATAPRAGPRARASEPWLPTTRSPAPPPFPPVLTGQASSLPSYLLDKPRPSPVLTGHVPPPYQPRQRAVCRRCVTPSRPIRAPARPRAPLHAPRRAPRPLA